MTQPQASPPTFAAEIAALLEQAPPLKSKHAELLVVWDEFARALKMVGIDAEIRRADDGLRYHLVLWPSCRPAWRSFVLTFRLDIEGVEILPHGSAKLRSREELEQFLRTFAQSETFRATLAELKHQAEEPVLAILELDNEPDVNVEVSPEMQRRLHNASGDELEIEVTFVPGEPMPRPPHIKRLRSAGVELDVSRAEKTPSSLLLFVSRH